MQLSRYSSASSSSLSSAYISSEARIFFARVYICFSPVDRPLSASRIARLRTTSASSNTSPVLILSRLCLKRRFQFFGIWLTSSRRTARTLRTSSSPMTRRRPALAAFSHGTMTVMSLWRILIVRYSRLSPSTSFISFFWTTPAPWWGYTTWSPISYSMYSTSRSRTMSSSNWSSHVTSVMTCLLSSLRFALRLEVAIHEVYLLQASQALAYLLGPDVPHAVHGLQVRVGGCQDLVEPPQVAHDGLDHELGHPRDAPEDPVAARRDRVVERVELAVVPEQLRQPPEIEQVLVRQSHE